MPWAYFARLPLDEQWGNGWKRVPYEKDAGLPYGDAAHQILTIAFDGPLLPPNAGHDSRERSVNEINRRTKRGSMQRCLSVLRTRQLKQR